MPVEQRPVRTSIIHVDEGDDIDRLRSAFTLGADSVWFDLEDHVPRHKLPTARANIRQVIEENWKEQTIFVRVNRFDANEILDDLEGVVVQGLHGILLPKVEEPEEVLVVDKLLTIFERKAGIEEGSVIIWPLLESAQGNRKAYEVATISPRVGYLGALANHTGDPARSIGYQWTREMSETSYIRQKVLLDVRAAGIKWPVSGVWNPLHDLEGLENFAIQCKNIGYNGLMVMPNAKHVEIVNRVFTPDQAEIDYWAEITRLMDAADSDVVPDLVVNGEAIPANRHKWAKLRLDLAAAYGVFPRDDRPRLKAQSAGRASEAWRNVRQ